MPSTFQINLKDWVDKVLEVYAKDCLTLKMPRRPITSAVHEKYFATSKVLSYNTLVKLRTGKACEPAVIQTFAKRLDLTAVDGAELMIRWGESYINRYAYKVPDAQMDSFLRNYGKFPDQTISELKVELRAFMKSPQASVATGISTHLAASGKSKQSIKSVPYKTLARFAVKGKLRRTAFNKLLNELKPKMPALKASREARKAEPSSGGRPTVITCSLESLSCALRRQKGRFNAFLSNPLGRSFPASRALEDFVKLVNSLTISKSIRRRKLLKYLNGLVNDALIRCFRFGHMGLYAVS
jgi:hypothetical protein